MWRSINLVVWLCLLWPSFVSAKILPDSMTLVYRVRIGSAELGSLSSKLQRFNGTYVVNSETRAEGMASILLGGAIRETCRFTTIRDQIKPLHYRFKRVGSEPFDKSAAFNWDKRNIHYNNGEITSIPKGYIIDNCGVPYAFMLGGADIFQKNELHVVGSKRVHHFKNIGVVEERVSTPLGIFDTVKIQQIRVDNPDRSLTVWIVPERNNLPVKILERRKRRTTTMELKSVEGL